MLAARREPTRTFRGEAGTIMGNSRMRAQIQERRPASTIGSHWFITPMANASTTSYAIPRFASVSGRPPALPAYQYTSAEMRMPTTARASATGVQATTWPAGRWSQGTMR